ncbi:ribonuclease H-like domain-containing protein [Podospora didyma]|uniref:Ribonuclease H n=1 Tax=Podospora didyma TaxID=330526 RepID=A0AAE0NHR8_9PEZI|nr:ribonuclease H-like domain-containing protein [Podospora didyma]
MGKLGKKGNEPRYYAVHIGRKPGVYSSWPLCEQQTTGFPGAKYWSIAEKFLKGSKKPKFRKFNTYAEAEAFMEEYGEKEQTDEYDDEEVSDDADTAPPTKKHKPEEESDDADGPPKKKLLLVKPESTDNSELAKTAVSIDGFLIIYTDGSSLNNGKRNAVAGVGVYFGEGDPRNISEPLVGNPQTNQRAELTAILRALQVVDTAQSIEIRTDSDYSRKCVTEWYRKWERNGWRTGGKEVKNQDLVKAIRELIEERENEGAVTKIQWVKAHAEDLGNIAADALAVAASRRYL